jgi:hypothetical protein
MSTAYARSCVSMLEHLQKLYVRVELLESRERAMKEKYEALKDSIPKLIQEGINKYVRQKQDQERHIQLDTSDLFFLQTHG